MGIRKSIKAKMAMLFIVAAIPLYAVGLSLYGTSGKQLIMETIETKKAQMAFYLQSVDDELHRLTQRDIEVINDSSVGSLASRYQYFSIYERGRRINTLRDNLLSIRQSCAYVDTVTIYLAPIGMKLNDRAGLDVMSEEDSDLILTLAQNARGIISMKDGTLYSSVFINDTSKRPYYALVVRLSTDSITGDLKGMKSTIPTQSVVVYDGSALMARNSAEAEKLWEEAKGNLADMREGDVLRLSVGGEAYYVTCARSPFLRCALFNFTRERDLTGASAKYMPYFIALTAAVLVLIIMLVQGTNALVHQPLQKLMAAFHRIREGDLSVKIQHHRHDEFSDVYQSFNQTAEMLDEYVNRSLKQELLLRRSEIMQLQAQINPHFLYNSYFMLHRMVKRQDWDNAVRFSGYMGEYFRYITRNSEQLVPLEMEAEHARIYAKIQQMRFGSRISVEFGEVPDTVRQLLAPRLILQPVLENAFEHGMRDVVEGGLIRVRFYDESGSCVITVEDNSDVLSEADLNRLIESMEDVAGEVTALKNICHRLKLRSDDGLGFELLRSPLGGLCVRMIIRAEVRENETADRG